MAPCITYSVEISSKGDGKSIKVDNFTSSVDLRLKHCLSLADHRRSQNVCSVLCCNKVTGFEEDGGSVFERHGLPLSPCLYGGVNGVLDVLLAGVVVLGYNSLMVIRL